jgi:hypothetical protein
MFGDIHSEALDPTNLNPKLDAGRICKSNWTTRQSNREL